MVRHILGSGKTYLGYGVYLGSGVCVTGLGVYVCMCLSVKSCMFTSSDTVSDALLCIRA